MGDKWRHHFVPQVYLKYFAKKKKGKKYFIYVFDYKQGKTYPKNVKDVAYQKDYNRVHSEKNLPPVPDNNELYYEEKFRTLIENDWNSIVHRFTATCTLSPKKKILSHEMKFLLAKLIMIQSLRTPIARAKTREIAKKSCQKVFDELTPIINKSTREDLKQAFFSMKRDFQLTDDLVKAFHLSATTDNDRIERMAHLLVQRRVWVVYRSPDIKNFPFITSDNPVVFYNPISDKYGIGPNGIDVNTTVIGFPVTPRYYIYSFHKESPLGDISSCADECIDVDPEIIRIVDAHQTNQCYEHVFLPPELGKSWMKE